jgi:hypothetical protein
MARPNQTHDRLDALLDGRPGEVTDDLAPLLAAAAALRGELAEFELDPEVVARHLEQALDRPATVVPLPVRDEDRGGGLRRRLIAVGLAAALVLVPATAASAASGSALPGQPLYPVKIAFEQFRLATVQWSPTLEAQERAKLAAKRLDELSKLVKLRMFHQIPLAIRALDKAVAAANAAVIEAAEDDGRPDPKLDAFNRLTAVAVEQHRELVALKQMGSQLPVAVTQAVKGSPAALQPNLPTVPPPLQSAVTTPTTQPQSGPTSAPTTQPQSEPTSAPTQPEQLPPTTTPTPNTDTTTTEASTTTAPTTTTAGSDGNPDGAGSGSGGNSGRAGSEGTPPSSGP